MATGVDLLCDEGDAKLYMRISPPSLSVVTMYILGERNEKFQNAFGPWSRNKLMMIRR